MENQNSKVDFAASELSKAYQEGNMFPETLNNLLNVDTAYDTQFKFLELRENQGEKLVGWKVGLTSLAMQQQQGVHEPCLGHLLKSGHCQSPAPFRFHDLHAPGFENELCIRMNKSISPDGISPEIVINAIDAVAPALEIIEKRSAFGMDFPLAIAGNAQQHSFVTGEFIKFDPELDLSQVTVNVAINNDHVAEAKGKEVLGTPINSIIWLAEKLSQYDRSIEEGDMIMTGSFTKQFALEQGDHINASFTGIGNASAIFD